jgi:serine/threonine-protein kinase RsbW
MTMSSESSVEVRLPSRLGYEKIAMNAAATMAKDMGFSEDRIDDLKTAVAEACINAMEHGNQLNAEIPMGIVLSMSQGELEVKVLDDGNGMETAPSPDKPDIDRKMSGEEEARGMGMFLIQALVDEVEWVPRTEGQSFVRLVIRLNKENE